MHIAFFTNTYLPVISGVVRSVESYREALTKLGHNVFIFAQFDNGYEDSFPFVYRYPSLPLPVQTDVSAVIPVSPFVEQLLLFLKPDVIHTHHPFLLGQAAARRAEALSVPLIFTFHTQYTEYTHYFPLPQDIIQEFLKGAIKNWLVEYMQRCQHIVIPSESMKDILIRDYGLKERYTVIPTGMDLEPFRRADGHALRVREGWQNDFVLVSTGRLAIEKNWPTLLQAAQKVYHEHPALRLVLIGDGPEKSALMELAADLGMAERVTFTGAVPFSEVPAYLKAADLFGFASVTETQGLATMEAIAAGLPVVAVDASGTRDIIENGKQGFLVADDADALANAISSMISSPDKRMLFRHRALKKAKTFDIEKLAKQLVRVYEQSVVDKAEGQYVKIENVEERKEN